MVWKIIIIILGSVMFYSSFNAMLKNKLTGYIGMGWGFISLFLILAGLLPGLSDWSLLMNNPGSITIFIFCIIIFVESFLFCKTVSKLLFKNQELAMNISLLNQENERINHVIEELDKN